MKERVNNEQKMHTYSVQTANFGARKSNSFQTEGNSPSQLEEVTKKQIERWVEEEMHKKGILVYKRKRCDVFMTSMHS